MKTKISKIAGLLILSGLLLESWTFKSNAQDDIYYTPSKNTSTATNLSASNTVKDTSGMTDYEKYRAMRDGGSADAGNSSNAPSGSIDQYTSRGTADDSTSSVNPNTSGQQANQGSGTTIINNYNSDEDYDGRFSTYRSLYFDYYNDPFLYGYDPYLYGGFGWGFGFGYGLGWGFGLGMYSPGCYWGYSPYYYSGFYSPYYGGYWGGYYGNEYGYGMNRAPFYNNGGGRRVAGNISARNNYSSAAYNGGGRRAVGNNISARNNFSSAAYTGGGRRTAVSNVATTSSVRRATPAVSTTRAFNSSRLSNIPTTRSNVNYSQGTRRSYTPSYNTSRMYSRPSYNSNSAPARSTNYATPRRSSEGFSPSRSTGYSAPHSNSGFSGGGRSSGGYSGGSHSSGGGGRR
jgi:hypothetical protein